MGRGYPATYADPSSRAPLTPEERHPIAATVLTVIAAVLIIFAGLAVAAVGSAVSNLGYALGGAISGLGFLGALFGLIDLVLAIYLYANPGAHVGVGIGILIVSLLSLVGGAGFFLGLILGVIGGVLAIVFEPDEGEWPDEFSAHPSTRPTVPAWRTCSSCGQTVAPGILRCARCGAPVM